MEFESATYTAQEAQRLVAGLRLSGGTFSSTIMVAVIPSDQRPVSAQGELYVVIFSGSSEYYCRWR